MIRKSLILFFALFTFTVLPAKTIRVNNIEQYNKHARNLLPGDSIVLENGIWQNAQLIFKGDGTKGKYIYLMAETPGKVILEGASSLELSGKWLHISGLEFIHGHAPRKTVIDFKTGANEYAYHCVISNCVIDGFNQPSKKTEDHWIGVWGKHNTIEYCYFGGKTNAGTTLVIWPNDSNCINNENLIYRNYFGERPRLGFNGGETIRIGTSEVHTNISGSVVEGNYFEHCNGEIEIISNKSVDNKFLNNTFFECEGTLTLRHGNDAVVSGNWFIGNGRKKTGGVRVINEGHKIYNNYFYELRGTEMRSALTIMDAIPNSPANGYNAVKNVVIANNTFYDCSTPWTFGVGFGSRNRIVRPESTLLINNLVYCPNDSDLITQYDKSDGIALRNNLMINSQGALNNKSTVQGQVFKAKVNDIDMICTNASAKPLSFVTTDILGQNRNNNPVVGAFQNREEKVKVELATDKNCGPKWYHPIAEK